MTLLMATAIAAPLVEPMGDAVEVDWGRAEVRVVASSAGDASASTRAAEELARRAAETALRSSLRTLRVDCTSVLSDVLARPQLGPAVEARLARWDIATSTYDLRGRVAVDGVLSLVDLLKPLGHARAVPRPPGPEPDYTGVVVDARGSSAEPTWMPRIVGADGAVLWDGALVEEAALAAAPAAWVRTMEAPEAARAGARPMVLRAPSSSGCSLVLDAADSVRWRTALGTAALPYEGRVVVLVD